MFKVHFRHISRHHVMVVTPCFFKIDQWFFLKFSLVYSSVFVVNMFLWRPLRWFPWSFSMKLDKVIHRKPWETRFRNGCDTNLWIYYDLKIESTQYQPFKRLVSGRNILYRIIYLYICKYISYHSSIMNFTISLTRTAWQLAALAWTMQSSHATSAVLLLHLWQRKRKRHQSQLAFFWLGGWVGWVLLVGKLQIRYW